MEEYDMKLRELLNGVPVASCAVDLEMEINGVSYDSRATQPGDLFVAMTGYATDGHKYSPRRWKRARRRYCARICQRETVPISARRIPAVRWR